MAFRKVRITHDFVGCQRITKELKRLLVFRRPLPIHIVLGQVGEALGDFAVILDKLTIVTGQAEKRSKPLDIFRSLPGSDLLDVGRIWRDALWR